MTRLPSRRSAKNLPALNVTKNAACIASVSRRGTWLTPRPQVVQRPQHRPAQDHRRLACLKPLALRLHRLRTLRNLAKVAARMALPASVPTAVRSATSKPTESQYPPPNSFARVRFRISDLKKRKRQDPAGRGKLVVLTRLSRVALLRLPEPSLLDLSLLAAPSPWDAWTYDWNFNIQIASFKELAVTRSCMCMHSRQLSPCLHMLSNTDTAAISNNFSYVRACSRFQHRELSPFQVSIRECLVTPVTTIPQITNVEKEFDADFDDFHRLCPMLNGTWKPEDRPDGQGDSSFGAVPAALTL